MTTSGPGQHLTARSDLQLDPVTLVVVRDRMVSTVKQMASYVENASPSFITAEVHDMSTGIFDRDGRPVALFSDIANQQMGYFQIRRAFEDIEEFSPGDVVVMNDAYLGAGSHLDDWSFYRPVFYQDELQFFAMIRGHQMDTGGSHPGGYHAEPFDLHSEGIRLRPIKIVERGRLREDLYTLILDNVRFSQGVRMDHQSFLAALRFCENEVVDMLKKYGVWQLRACVDEMLARTSEAVRRKIAAIPDGTYFGEATCDDDGTDHDVPVTVRVKLTVDGSRMIADFSECDGQVKGFINCPRTLTYCKAQLALLTCIAPEMADYHNYGSFDSFEIVTRKGSVVDPVYPAPVGCCPVMVSILVLEAMWCALAQVIPQDVPAQPTRAMHPHIDGINPRTGRLYEIKNFWAEGGGGAVYGYDGWPNTGPAGGGVLAKSSIEVMEASFPWRALAYHIATDHVGHGQWRGGPGTVWALVNEAGSGLYMTGPTDGVQPYTLIDGWLGGKSGTTNQIFIVRNGERIPVAGKRNTDFREGDEIWHISGGGAGVGDPLERDPDLVLADVQERILSRDVARSAYGVVVDPQARVVDRAATERIRKELKARRSD